MKTLKIALLSAMLAITSAAFAASAVYDASMKQIDAAMATGKHTPSTTDEVKKLVADSQRMMKENKEAEAMKLLDKAKELLKIK